MSYTPLTELADDLSIIGKLGDEPNSDNGLSADELKDKFDAAGLIIQAYINGDLKSKIDSIGGDLDDLADTVASIIAQVIPVGSITATELADGAVTTAKIDTSDFLLPMANGGTGVTSFPSGQVLIGQGSNPITTRGIKDNSTKTAPSNSSQYLVTERTLAYAIGVANGAAVYNEWHNLGTNAINAAADDTPANWFALGSGYSEYNANNISLPHNDGLIINYAPKANMVFQFYFDKNYTAVYHRRCNSDGSAWGTWTKLANTTDNVASATQLETGRTITTNLASSSGASFNGTADVTPGVTGTLGVANGGTGATTVAAARNALGLGNTNGALPVANGGTGATTAATARTNLGITPSNIGAAAASHNHNATDINAGTLGVARGGTGASTFTSGQALIGAGTNAVTTRAIKNLSAATAVATGTDLVNLNTLYYSIFRLAQIPTITNAKLDSGIAGSKITSPTTLGAFGARRIWIGSSAPSDPAKGDLWLKP